MRAGVDVKPGRARFCLPAGQIADEIRIPLGNGPGDACARAIDLFTDYFQIRSFLSLAVSRPLDDRLGSVRLDNASSLNAAPQFAALPRRFR
jgi:hypothetical protein